MKQKTKVKQLTAYLIGICIIAFSNLSCTNEENGSGANLGNGDVSGIITDDHDLPLPDVTVTVRPPQTPQAVIS